MVSDPLAASADCSPAWFMHILTHLLCNSGYFASSCDEVAPISIWLQIPNVALGAMSEIFVNVTSYELAYARKNNPFPCTVSCLLRFAWSTLVSPWA